MGFTYYNDIHPPQGRVVVCRKSFCLEPAIEEELCGVHLLEQQSLRSAQYRDPRVEARAERETSPERFGQRGRQQSH